MSLAAIWDRFWWSLMLTIALGLLWLKFVDPILSCDSVGLIVCITIGATYFAKGINKLAKQQKVELAVEENARKDLLASLQKEENK
jgi:hypothetical protein